MKATDRSGEANDKSRVFSPAWSRISPVVRESPVTRDGHERRKPGHRRRPVGSSVSPIVSRKEGPSAQEKRSGRVGKPTAKEKRDTVLNPAPDGGAQSRREKKPAEREAGPCERSGTQRLPSPRQRGTVQTRPAAETSRGASDELSSGTSSGSQQSEATWHAS